MLVTCPKCGKKLNVAETLAGKKVPCPGCKTTVSIPAQQIATAPSPSRREVVSTKSPEPQAPTKTAAALSAVSTMRCAACKVAALRPLPPNAFSRRPGYVCSECGKVMRPPGTTGTYVFVVFLGTFVFLASVFGFVGMWLLVDEIRKPLISGMAVGIAVGAASSVWAIKQLTRPVPLDAPKRPIRIGVVLFLLLIALLLASLIGAVVFGLMYMMHEM
jgi:hypothetical protein